ncbi:hypothetical protein M3Y99_01799200 [Aphelenchoides fujianensis]|nr:hypothetical protein M3Y99_01799200 [Aphelenchoides fujianensis]
MWLLVLLPAVWGQEVFQLYFNYGCFELEVGTPGQPLVGLAVSTTDALVVVDEECGHVRDAECPAFCRDGALAELFCGPKCEADGRFAFACAHSHSYYGDRRFSAANSTSFERTGGEWAEHLGLESAQFGWWARDAVAFRPAFWTTGGGLRMEGARLVDGLLFDINLLRMANAFVGLADGDANFVRRLHAAGRIPAPVLTLVAPDAVALVGGAAWADCANWTAAPSLAASWALAFEAAEFVGSRWTRAVASFDLTSGFVYIPNEKYDELLAEGVLLPYGHYYKVLCNVSFELRFELNGRPFVIPSGDLIDANPNGCFLRFLPVRESFAVALYADEPQWILGSPALSTFCLSFDYAAGELSIGDYGLWETSE